LSARGLPNHRINPNQSRCHELITTIRVTRFCRAVQSTRATYVRLVASAPSIRTDSPHTALFPVGLVSDCRTHRLHAGGVQFGLAPYRLCQNLDFASILREIRRFWQSFLGTSTLPRPFIKNTVVRDIANSIDVTLEAGISLTTDG
jgi:hypothetical protein